MTVSFYSFQSCFGVGRLFEKRTQRSCFCLRVSALAIALWPCVEAKHTVELSLLCTAGRMNAAVYSRINAGTASLSKKACEIMLPHI